MQHMAEGVEAALMLMLLVRLVGMELLVGVVRDVDQRIMAEIRLQRQVDTLVE